MIKNIDLVTVNKYSNSFKELLVKIYILIIIARNNLIKILMFLLSYLVFKNENILLFSSVGNYNFSLFFNEDDYQVKESPKYLAIYAADNCPEYKSYYHCPNKYLFNSIKKKGIKPVRGFYALWIMLRAKYIFVDNNNFISPNPSF